MTEELQGTLNVAKSVHVLLSFDTDHLALVRRLPLQDPDQIKAAVTVWLPPKSNSIVPPPPKLSGTAVRLPSTIAWSQPAHEDVLAQNHADVLTVMLACRFPALSALLFGAASVKGSALPKLGGVQVFAAVHVYWFQPAATSLAK